MDDRIKRALRSEFDLGGSDGIPDIDSIDGAKVIHAHGIDDLKKQMSAAGIPNASKIVDNITGDIKVIETLKKVGMKYNKTPWELIRIMATFNTNSYVLDRAKQNRENPAETLEDLLQKSEAILGAAIEANEQIFGNKNSNPEDIIAQLLMAIDILVREVTKQKPTQTTASAPSARTFKDIIEGLFNKEQ